MASSMSEKTKTKLSVRNQTCFKKSSLSLSKREETMFRKAFQLSTLCNIEVCAIYYDRDGELIKTWPEDQFKVRDMAERFCKLNANERRKKSTNLSQILYKKILNEKKISFENNDAKFSEKVLEMEGSLESGICILQDRLRWLLQPQNQTESVQSHVVSPGFFTTNLALSSELGHHQQWAR